MIYGGMYMGEILGFSLSGLLVSSTIEMDGISYPWEWVFYLFGLWGVVWFPLWAMYAYERPEDHPGIDREELMLIGEGKRSFAAAVVLLCLLHLEHELRCHPWLCVTLFISHVQLLLSLRHTVVRCVRLYTVEHS